ncbi:MAG: AraC family transcriptional regulator [Clostridiales bacterium]|nr:AraC family transcriptional regulator [Clostridiales bacterium]
MAANYYITYGEFQKHLTNYYQKTGSKMQFMEMIRWLFQEGLLSEVAPEPPITAQKVISDMSDEEINRFIDSIPITVQVAQRSGERVSEADIFPGFRDIFIIRHPRHTRELMHVHNYFEINYVAEGECVFKFEDDSRTLKEGEFCMIAPGSSHDLVIDSEATVFCIMLRGSTLTKPFAQLRSCTHQLTEFSHAFLSGSNKTNYLLFFCERGKWIRQIIFNAMMECYKSDDFSNICCISWLNQMFVYLLRNYSETLRFYDYQFGSEFILILQYIQHHYQNLTLSDLAVFFHYSEPYLSTLIKQNTGRNFTDLVKELRMAEAVDCLIHTDMTVREIAEQVGYHSADHFSRTFRAEFQMSPQQFRKVKRTEDNDLLSPFQTL